MTIGTLRTLALATAAILWSAGAIAQSAPPSDSRTIPAPWWMRDPVIAAMGHVHMELPANRAEFSAEFSEVGQSVESAGAAAARRSAPLDAQLKAFGPARVQFTRTYSVEPLYRQYRNAEGNRVENERADQIENYQVVSTIKIEVIDVALIEQVYNAVAAASPSSIKQIEWSLNASDETVSALAIAAMRDATRRAREGAEAAGSRLGPIRIIDPSGGVCTTQVLAAWPSYGNSERSREVYNSATAVTAVSGENLRSSLEAPQTYTLRPPLERLDDRACVIFALQ